MIRAAVPALMCLFLLACADKKTNSQNNNLLKEIATLELDEISGLQYINGVLWGQEDSGNKNNIYKIDLKTGKHEGVTVKNTENIDWEDITRDAASNLYIGDFGNNSNRRRDLGIYKLNKSNNDVEYTVNFYYPDQKDFPPKKKERNFDCEAFFEYRGNFYLFSKNRSVNSDGTVLVHKLPNRRGYHSVTLTGSFVTCDNFRKCAIAGADISPDGKTVALISGAKLWLLTNYEGDDFANGKLTSYDLGETTQKESICFKDNTTLLIADERDKKTGGKLYELNLKDLKTD